MQERSWKRRNFFIKKDFQGKFMLRSFILILAGAFVFAAILSVFSAHTVTMTYEDSYLRLDRTPKALMQEVIRAYGLYIFLLGIVISGISLFLSHRVAGPLYRLEKSVEEIMKGNLAFKITLRQKDETKELADLMNTMIGSLSSRIKDASLNADAAYYHLASLKNRLSDEKSSHDVLNRNISEALDSIEKMRQTLSFFRTEKG